MNRKRWERAPLFVAIAVVASTGLQFATIGSAEAATVLVKCSKADTTSATTTKFSLCTYKTQKKGVGTMTQTGSTTGTLKWKAPFIKGASWQIKNIKVAFPQGAKGCPTG